MANFFPVSPLFWNDQKVLEWSEAERLLALYLLTSEHRNLEGLFRLPYSYVAEDLEWELYVVADRMQRLIDDGFLSYDKAAKVVLIRNAMKFHSPGSKRQLKGALNALRNVPPTTLWGEFVMACERHCPSLFNLIAESSQSDTEDIAEGLAI